MRNTFVQKTEIQETFTTPFRHSRVTQFAANAVYGGLTYDHLQAVAEHGLPVSPFSGCVGCLILSHSVPSFCFALFLCFLSSSIFLVHNICTSVHASGQGNRNLVRCLVSRETIMVDASMG